MTILVRGLELTTFVVLTGTIIAGLIGTAITTALVLCRMRSGSFAPEHRPKAIGVASAPDTEQLFLPLSQA
jgi:hypothetical protein